MQALIRKGKFEMLKDEKSQFDKTVSIKDIIFFSKELNKI